MDLIEKFKYRIIGSVLETDRTYLLAVSGGPDSMCLADILRRSNIPFEVAHYNFGLRDKESDGDEAFVQAYCSANELRFHVQHFDLKGESNIQERARELRYAWFRELLVERELAGILTAHHADDDMETFFINLLRGSGLRGLSGMDFVNENVIRPLLFARKADIEFYVEQNSIEYRIDSSNESKNYLRNRIRQELLPLIDKIKPGASDVIKRGQENIRIQLRDLERYYELSQEKIVHVKDDQIHINKNSLEDLGNCSGFLEFVLAPFGFTRDSILKASNWQDLETGKQFNSPSHVLTVDREALIVSPCQIVLTDPFVIQEQDTNIEGPLSLRMSVLNEPEHFTNDERVAQFDAEEVQFPLTLRKWQHADRLVPLGMKGSKLVSDLLIDEKIPRNDKENTYVLCSNNRIMWVLGVRISEKFKVTSSSAKILHFQII